VKLGEAPDFTIPVLKDWSYNFKKLETGMDEAGQVLGIEHSKFEKLIDSNGKAIPPDKSYHVYNAFIDFHGMNNIFAEEMPGGAGIQDLKKIGQKIVHSASFIQAPVNVGSNVAEGSYFKNGEVTLEFKGISTVNNSICALVAYDSGESYFHMQMNPMPDMEVVTNGSSHYMGDIYIDLESYWVQKVTLSEFLVHETTLPVPPNKINAVSERMIVIRNVSEGDFFKE
ncbi:MAG: hypothetical protein JXI43_13015, partial [Tissierellales bacterium]|nr:hypothetical protein [Tissierellales bacterium]